MDHVRRHAKPALRRPRALIALEGWGDASEAASGAVEHLIDQYEPTETFAELEPEAFYDFQAHRPIVTIDAGGTRSLTWPGTSFHAATLPGDGPDLVIVRGTEPSYQWKTYARSIGRLLAELGVEEVIQLGAFIGRVAHTRPVPLIGVATDPDLVFRHGLATSHYEGPTSILSVLQEAFREEGMAALSIWAAVPHYLAANPNPRVMLALITKAGEIFDLPLDLAELLTVVEEFSAKVDSAMQELSGDFAEYVTRLEAEAEAGALPAAAVDAETTRQLMREIEAFLEDQT